MAITTISSRDFNHDAGKAKKASEDGPVFITDRGVPKHVLLSVKDYRRLSRSDQSILDMLAMPAAADIDFNPEPLRSDLINPVDFDH
jgi:prevent-host-death family protein